MNRIRILMKRPGKEPVPLYIENTLHRLQELVEGYIETVTIATDVCLICNEEGRLKGMPYNCRICGVDFVGPVLVVGVCGDEFCSLPENSINFLKERLF